MDEAQTKGEPAGQPDSDTGTETSAETGGATAAGTKAEPKTATKPKPKPKTATKTEPAAGTKGSSADTVRSVRNALASAIWVLAVVAALVLAAGALVIALDFNTNNGVVSFIRDTADRINVLGTLKKFEPSGRGPEARQDALVKTVLVSWGICAIAYLVVGKVLDRLIRP
jgi:hypothetical protein